MKKMQEVICISKRNNDTANLTQIGEHYLLDVYSVYGDPDGDWYGKIYRVDETFVANMLLKHFKSVI